MSLLNSKFTKVAFDTIDACDSTVKTSIVLVFKQVVGPVHGSFKLIFCCEVYHFKLYIKSTIFSNQEKYPVKYEESMNTVLSQELIR